jgi:DNA-binding PadR family transcriptional regulator
MATGKVSLRYLVLGLLAQQPMSGYDIKRFLKGLSWLIGSPSSGSLYPVLRTLLEEGLVTVEIVPGVDRPPRKIYSIENAGREVLQAWIEQPIASELPLKAFVMRLLLAESFPPANLAEYLRQRRAQVAAHQAELVRITQTLPTGTDLGLNLALNYGLDLASAEIAWLDSTLDKLSYSPSPQEGGQSRKLADWDGGLRGEH